MLALNLPPYTPKIKKKDRLYIWDRIRRKYVVLTSEEWVRQHFVNYLISDRGYPEALIANEVQIKLNARIKRCDTIVYNRLAIPFMVIEYKAPEIDITQDVFDQIIRYNMELKVKYLIVSNGMKHYCCRIDYSTIRFEYISNIPTYKTLKNEF